MFSLRQAARAYARIRHLPHLLPRNGDQRRNSGSEESELVTQSQPANAPESASHTFADSDRFTRKDMYINLLIRIKNAGAAKKEKVKIPYTEMDFKIAEILAREGIVGAVEKKGRLPKRIIEIRPAYKEGKAVMAGVRFLSTPGRRIYRGWRELRLVRQGYGFAVLSTPQGIMTNHEARKAKVGGEMLFEIW